MFPFSVVEDLNVLEYGLQGVLGALKTFAMDQFRLDDAEKGLGHSVIPAISFATHAAFHLVCNKQFLKTVTTVLAASI